MKKPVIDEMICMHCGLCAQTCPEVFTEEPKVKEEADFEKSKEGIEQAIAFCPAGAISWKEKN